jgi:3-oxoacyl-[acyl-carrier protein] reductase
MARLFSAEGAVLALVGRRSAPLEETAGLLDGEALVLPTDVTDERSVVEMVRRTVEQFGRIDVLLNNAARPGVDQPIWERSLDNWNATLAIDLTAAMLCTREAIAQSMLERRSGSIVNFSSTAGLRGAPLKSSYCVAKGALRILTSVAAQDAGPYGIRVNCVIPGMTATDLLLDSFASAAGARGVTMEEIRQEAETMHALRRIATPEETAYTALFFGSDESSAITGQSLIVDAGMVNGG